MTPADVARQHQFREGFTLVDYAEVGLPVFRLTIEAVTTSYRSIPAIQEFVMRCMALGEDNEDAIARMLGLKRELVEGAMNGLVTDGLAARTFIPGDESAFRLTEAGEHRLADELVEVPQEEMLVIDYDGIRRTPIRLTGQSVVRAAELRQHGAVEIRPYPAEPPAIAELPIPDVSRVIRRQSGEEFRRTVLALKRIVRRNNVFQEAVALVYTIWEEADRAAAATANPAAISAWHLILEIPTAVPAARWKALVTEFVEREIASRGRCAAWAIHALEGTDDWIEKPHCHLVVTALGWRHDARHGRRALGSLGSWGGQRALELAWRRACSHAQAWPFKMIARQSLP